MSFQISDTVANAMLDSIETTLGTAPLLRLYSGAEPALCSTARSGTKLVEMTLPSDWMANASGRSKAKSGTWSASGLAGAGAGTNAGYYSIMDSTGTTCHLQGNVTATGGGGDMTLDNINIAQNQVVTVTGYTLGTGN